VALYLRGFGAGCPRRRWPLVAGALRTAACARKDAPDVLVAAGLSDEAHGISDLNRLDQAEGFLADGRVLAVGSPGYPTRWKEVLGAAAPPALWAGGVFSMSAKACFGIVGSREPLPAVPTVVSETVRHVGSLGFEIITGGARGVDRIASKGATSQGVSCLELLPAARREARIHAGDCDRAFSSRWLSLNPPLTPVGSATLMERNALIYAASTATAVFQPRFRAGGTWHGATEALRRRLCRVLVHRGIPAFDMEPAAAGDLAVRALLALGAEPFTDGCEIPDVLARGGRQPTLPLAEPW